MNRDDTVLARRAQLQAKSAILRQRLASHTRALEPVWAGVDRARRAASFVRAHPWIPALALAALCLSRPRRAVRWAWAGWRGLRRWSQWRALWHAVRVQ